MVPFRGADRIKLEGWDTQRTLLAASLLPNQCQQFEN